MFRDGSVGDAQLSTTYDNGFRPDAETLTVGASSAKTDFSFQLDGTPDGADLYFPATTQVADYTLTPDVKTGLLKGTVLTSGAGSISSSIGYNGFGELDSEVFTHSAQGVIAQMTYSDGSAQRDGLGRITSRTEELKTGPDTTEKRQWEYEYTVTVQPMTPSNPS
jgi:hypothetical protein